MPYAPMHQCNYSNCLQAVPSGQRYCPVHKKLQAEKWQSARKEAIAKAETKRGTARERGYTTQWDKARAAYLREHPLCASCTTKGKTVTATVVDHIIPHQGDHAQFWDAANWQPLCRRCHTIKTRQEIRQKISRQHT
jgi:5-methylcytosine-specific restriction protein A